MKRIIAVFLTVVMLTSAFPVSSVSAATTAVTTGSWQVISQCSYRNENGELNTVIIEKRESKDAKNREFIAQLRFTAKRETNAGKATEKSYITKKYTKYDKKLTTIDKLIEDDTALNKKGMLSKIREMEDARHMAQAIDSIMYQKKCSEAEAFREYVSISKKLEEDLKRRLNNKIKNKLSIRGVIDETIQSFFGVSTVVSLLKSNESCREEMRDFVNLADSFISVTKEMVDKELEISFIMFDGSGMYFDKQAVKKAQSVFNTISVCASASVSYYNSPNLNKTFKAAVKATGTGLKYQWYIKNAKQTQYSKSSVKSATYFCKMTSASRNRCVYCVISDKKGNKVTTKPIILRMSVRITIQPKTKTVKKNAIAKTTIKADGDGLKYQWYVKLSGTSKYAKSSIKTATYSVKMTASAKNRQVYCVVTDKYGKTIKSNAVFIKKK